MLKHSELTKLCTNHPDIEQMVFVRFGDLGLGSPEVCFVANDMPHEMLLATAEVLRQIYVESPTMLTNRGWAQPPEEAELRVIVGDLQAYLAIGHPTYTDAFIVASFLKGAPVVKSLKRLLRRTFKHMGLPKRERQAPTSLPGEPRTVGGH